MSQTHSYVSSQYQTLELLRKDAYLRACRARVVKTVTEGNRTDVTQDQTVFYA